HWLGFRAQSLMVFFLGPAFLIGNLAYLYRDVLARHAGGVPWAALFVAIEWRHVPDSQWMGGVTLLIVQAFAVVWVGMAGTKLIPFGFPDISYGVYIYHFPLIMALKPALGITTLAEMLLALGVTLIPVCLASWYLIEAPALARKRH